MGKKLIVMVIVLVGTFVHTRHSQAKTNIACQQGIFPNALQGNKSKSLFQALNLQLQKLPIFRADFKQHK